jgi:hypothetical protein
MGLFKKKKVERWYPVIAEPLYWSPRDILFDGTFLYVMRDNIRARLVWDDGTLTLQNFEERVYEEIK